MRFCAARANDRFSLIVGETAPLSNVKYVITLDTDTQLPRDAARQFVGVMAHPLNRARFGAHGRRNADKMVTEGYGILQPRVGISLPGANRSWYARLHGGDPGIDPYTRAVSDVYQDVFGEGSFIGKGIYDVDAFERALNGRFPENRILSHDLLEGCYARSGLLSDVQLYEEYPSTYSADMSRRHRWIRGDWQLAGWLLPLVPGPGRRRLRNPLSALSRWKIFDNLRRSLVPAALTSLLLLGWTVLPHAWLWTLAVIAVLLLPSACAFVVRLLREAGRRAAASSTSPPPQALPAAHAAQTALTLAFLPYEATVNLDAIVRTSWRMLVTHRRLLEWNPSAMDDPIAAAARTHSSAHGLAASVESMWIAPVDRHGRRRSCWRHRLRSRWRPPRRSSCCGSFSPAIAWWMSRPLARREARLTTEQIALPANPRAQDLGVLRNVRRPGRPMAAAGQLAGASGRHGRASHLADEHGTRAARESDRLRLRLHPGRTTHRCARRTPWARCRPWSGTRAISTTGTTRSRASRCRRCTSRRWTAAISRVIC